MTRDYAFDQKLRSGARTVVRHGIPVGARGGLAGAVDRHRGANVTAIDIDTRFIEQFASDTIEGPTG